MITSLLLLTIYYNEKKKNQRRGISKCKDLSTWRLENSQQVLVDGMRQTSQKLHVHIYTSML